MTPTQRTLAELKRRGWIAQVVEQTIRIPGGRTFKRDLFGVIDVVAVASEYEDSVGLMRMLKPGQEWLLGIQTTSGSHHAGRREKILAEPRARAWMNTGAKIEIWSWSKRGPRGKEKRWTLRIEEVTA